MKVDWVHQEETNTKLESWSAVINGVELSIVNLQPHNSMPERAYSWTNALTGADWDYGYAENLETAMADAVQSVVKLMDKNLLTD